MLKNSGKQNIQDRISKVCNMCMPKIEIISKLNEKTNEVNYQDSGENLDDLGFGGKFLDITPKAQFIKEKKLY